MEGELYQQDCSREKSSKNKDKMRGKRNFLKQFSHNYLKRDKNELKKYEKCAAGEHFRLDPERRPLYVRIYTNSMKICYIL